MNIPWTCSSIFQHPQHAFTAHRFNEAAVLRPWCAGRRWTSITLDAVLWPRVEEIPWSHPRWNLHQTSMKTTSFDVFLYVFIGRLAKNLRYILISSLSLDCEWMLMEVLWMNWIRWILPRKAPPKERQEPRDITPKLNWAWREPHDSHYTNECHIIISLNPQDMDETRCKSWSKSIFGIPWDPLGSPKFAWDPLSSPEVALGP